MIWPYDNNEKIIKKLKEHYFSKEEWDFFEKNWNFSIDLVNNFSQIYEKNNNAIFKLEVFDNSFKELHKQILKELGFNNDR